MKSSRRWRQQAEIAASRITASRTYACAAILFAVVIRILFFLCRRAFRLLKPLVIWLATKSPLAEPRRSAHRPLLKLIPWIVVALAWVTVTLATAVAYYASVMPDPRDAASLPLPPNLTILTRSGEFIGERGMLRDYVKFKDLPPHLVKAVLATEDRRFFYHFGIDPIGAIRALSANWRSGDVVQGGSTITQQLVKNLYLRPERTWQRKAQEFILALWLEARFTKQEIIELYLNRVYFGAGNYGIGAAAHHYFGKKPSEITLAEAALLAGLIKAPTYYSPSANLDRARQRSREILRMLAEADDIDINQYAEALANPPVLKVQPSATGFGWVADWVAEIVPMLVSDTSRNLTVETTIDGDLQRAARSAMESAMRTKGRTAAASEAAIVLMTPEGAIRAMIGGRNHAESQFNRAVRAMRQPGSAFKPFIYLAAIESGYTPDTKIDDSPVEIGGWKPENFGNTYRGEITLRDALTHSSNMAAVRLTQALGPERVVATARRLGVQSARNVGPTIALGTSEVTLLDMTSAFSVFANGGRATVPEIIERIRDDRGRILFERSHAEPIQVVSLRSVAAMNDMMNAVVAGGTGRSASLEWHPAAGKTGTSQRFKDAWFVGFTAQWVGGVWVGNDNARPMRGITGGSIPAEIWKAVMDKAHEGLGVEPLAGTELDMAYLQKASDALGISGVPAHNPFRPRIPSMEDRKKLADIEADHREIARNR